MFRHLARIIAQTPRAAQAFRAARRLAGPALLACCTMVSTAQAALTVCNKTAHPTKIALGRFDGHDWTSQGWWAIAARACATLLPGPLKGRYYYLYATDSGAGGWGGGRAFCTSPTRDGFLIVSRANCAARGYERKGFFQVDTGQALDFTQSLSE